MSVTRVVRLADRRTMPWRNGGGVTHELCTEGDGSAGFAVRLSVAEVAQDGPFSRFPGVDRVIALAEGAGFVLTRDDGATARITRPGQAFVFHGEDAWACSLVSGTVRDFNVMVDRAAGRAVVRRVYAGDLEARWVFALGPLQVGKERLLAGELAEMDGRTPIVGAALAVSIET